ncbi:MAG: hypothetical protein V4620_02670 [Bacteroidota bacterium]
MSHVVRQTLGREAPKSKADRLKARKWKTVHVALTKDDFEKYFDFLNDAVVLRSSAEGVPLMTTTGIFGPIKPGTTVKLTYGVGTGVEEVPSSGQETTLIDRLHHLQHNNTPDAKHANTINANWVSGKDGGGIPGLSSSSNVFGGTGSLFINQSDVVIPVLDPSNEAYKDTLAFYGGVLLTPGEAFNVGFDLPLFGVEYDTSLPDYIRNYAMQPFSGGGMFVEHHEFPHIFHPRPDEGKEVYCEAKVTLGRRSVKFDPKNPQFTFTTFRVPADGSAVAILPGTIHNDSFTNGKLSVFVADVIPDKVDTVAFRESAPYKNIRIEDAND